MGKFVKIFLWLCLIIPFSISVPLKCPVDFSNNLIDCPGKELKTARIAFNPGEELKIKKINFANNNIREIEDLDDFPNLEQIDLKLNAIENISTMAFSPLKNLTSVDLSFNNIENLDSYVFTKNKHLKSVSLRGNLLSVTPEKPIVCSASLEVLDIGTCALTRITIENLLCLPLLKELDLSSNFLTALTPSVFSPLINLVSINLRTNRFYCDCKFPELLKWARSKKTDMVGIEPIFCVLSHNRGMTEYGKIEKNLNCSSPENAVIHASEQSQNENAAIRVSEKTQNEKASSSEFYDYILISYDAGVQPSEGRVSTRYMGLISNKLYTIEALLSLVLFLLVVITGMLFCRHYKTVVDIRDPASNYLMYSTDMSVSEKTARQLIQKYPTDHMYVHVK